MLLVPEARRNLISIRQLTKLGKNIIFSGDSVILRDSSGVEVTIGTLTDNLYVLNQNEAHLGEDQIEEYSLDIKLPATLDLLHRRFGHANINKIKEMVRQLTKLG